MKLDDDEQTVEQPNLRAAMRTIFGADVVLDAQRLVARDDEDWDMDAPFNLERADRLEVTQTSSILLTLHNGRRVALRVAKYLSIEAIAP